LNKQKEFQTLSLGSSDPQESRGFLFSPTVTTFEIGDTFAILDAADLPKLAGYTWRLEKGRNTQYAVARHGKNLRTSMHRLIMGAASDRLIDHRNGDGLDNRRSNLREATHQQNTFNRAPMRGGKSKFKGLWWDQAKLRWRAAVRLDGKKHVVGSFLSEEEAARAYDAKAVELFGPFARLNFPVAA
jgi:hypothetical protein